MKISIVTTLFRSEPYIAEFIKRATSSAQKLADDSYEIILVNDGSDDNSLAVAVDIAAHDNHVLVIDLSRNFGHHKAIMTGLAHAQGELVYLIDSDLEEEPEWLSDFYDILKRDICDVVYGVQKNRKGGMFERLSGTLYYFLLNRLTRMNFPQNIVTARLMTRRYVQALVLHKEREMFMLGLWHITGFKQIAHVVKKHHNSPTTYSFSKKISLLVTSITAFSSMPLITIFYLGSIITLISFFCVAYICINWLFFANPPDGWASLIASVWLLGGMIISFIGIIGIYLAKIFSETKQRPYTIVREIYGR